MIHIIITGGTLDKVYDAISGQLAFKHTHVAEGLELARFNLPYSIETLMLVDSLHLTQKDREHILQATQKTEAQKILITHGTDTMALTARYLADQQAKAKPSEKTIVLTGAMYPYHLAKSDALFNLGNALAFVQEKPPGTYIAMNGLCLEAHEAEKNHKLGVFEKKPTAPKI